MDHFMMDCDGMLTKTDFQFLAIEYNASLISCSNVMEMGLMIRPVFFQRLNFVLGNKIKFLAYD